VPTGTLRLFSYVLVTDSSECFSVPSKSMAATATLTSQATTRWLLCGILGGVVPSSSSSSLAVDLRGLPTSSLRSRIGICVPSSTVVLLSLGVRRRPVVWEL